MNPSSTTFTEIFVYGTLKRGGTNHHLLAGQRFIGAAQTIPGFRLYELDGYPGLVADPESPDAITGEIWAVDTRCLAELDQLEGLDEGLYRRERIPLAAPHADRPVLGYVYARSIAGRRMLGPTWPVGAPNP